MNDSISYQAGDKMRDLVRNNSALILVMGRFDISLGFGDKSVGRYAGRIMWTRRLF